MILDLLLINVIVALTYMSGFWESLDYYLNQKFKPYHLPHIFKCCLCQTFWLSVLYGIITTQPFLMILVLALLNAHLVDIMIPLLSTIKEWLQKLIEWIMPR